MKQENQKQNNDWAYEKSDMLRGPKAFGHILLWSCVLFIIVALIWAYNAILDEVTVAQGKVIPASKVQIIQNLEGGIIKEILVKEGQIVNKGQILMRIDDVRFSSTYQGGISEQHGLQIKINRIQSELDQKPFDPPAKLKDSVPDLYASELKLYTSKMDELKALEYRKGLYTRELNLNKPLLATGAISEVEVLRLEQQVEELQSSILKFKSDELAQMNEAKSQLNKLEKENTALQDRLDRTVVRSPVRGIVKKIDVTTVGGVLQPGMQIMEVVPLEDTLLVEGRVKPSDIGFLHPGQAAMVKISAYDFSIYGGLPAVVENISADTSIDQTDEQSYYEISVRTDRNFLLHNNEKLTIIPGMQTSIDIVTGHKSVLDYILKPLLKAKDNALREK